MPESSQPATMGDVAALAGVSHQTVSRVLNDAGAVRPGTRDRVERAIESLGYRRNVAARALVTRRSHTIGVIGSGVHLHGPASVVVAIERAARDAGYYVSLATERLLDEASLRDAVRRLRGQSVEGLVVINTEEQARAALADLSPGLPAVIVEGRADAGLTTVFVDQYDGARQATRHLLDQGVRTVVHLAGPAGWIEAEARVRGWRDTLLAAGAPVPELVRGDWSPASGHAAGRDLGVAGVEAVFASNDQMALGLVQGLHEADRRVPQDVLVVGFDDVPESAYYSPPLTTVRQDFEALGRHSIALLLAQMLDAAGPASVTVPAELVIRASSRRPTEAVRVGAPSPSRARVPTTRRKPEVTR